MSPATAILEQYTKNITPAIQNLEEKEGFIDNNTLYAETIKDPETLEVLDNAISTVHGYLHKIYNNELTLEEIFALKDLLKKDVAITEQFMEIVMNAENGYKIDTFEKFPEAQAFYSKFNQFLGLMLDFLEYVFGASTAKTVMDKIDKLPKYTGAELKTLLCA